jgi:hypothetical protein
MSETNGTCACGKSTSESKGGSCQIQNGKGDAPRHNVDKYRDNYGEINWSSGGRSLSAKSK